MVEQAQPANLVVAQAVAAELGPAGSCNSIWARWSASLSPAKYYRITCRIVRQEVTCIKINCSKIFLYECGPYSRYLRSWVSFFFWGAACKENVSTTVGPRWVILAELWPLGCCHWLFRVGSSDSGGCGLWREFKLRSKDGEALWFHQCLSPKQGPSGFQIAGGIWS